MCVLYFLSLCLSPSLSFHTVFFFFPLLFNSLSTSLSSFIHAAAGDQNQLQLSPVATPVALSMGAP